MDALARLEHLLGQFFGAVGADDSHGRYHARFVLPAADLSEDDSIALGIAVFRRLAQEAGPAAVPQGLGRVDDLDQNKTGRSRSARQH
jgi:hypothetical protein